MLLLCHKYNLSGAENSPKLGGQVMWTGSKLQSVLKSLIVP